MTIVKIWFFYWAKRLPTPLNLDLWTMILAIYRIDREERVRLGLPFLDFDGTVTMLKAVSGALTPRAFVDAPVAAVRRLVRERLVDECPKTS